MNIYQIKVTCEYYLDIEADTNDVVLEIAQTGEGDGHYELSDLQNFEYYVEEAKV